MTVKFIPQKSTVLAESENILEVALVDIMKRLENLGDES